MQSINEAFEGVSQFSAMMQKLTEIPIQPNQPENRRYEVHHADLGMFEGNRAQRRAAAKQRRKEAKRELKSA